MLSSPVHALPALECRSAIRLGTRNKAENIAFSKAHLLRMGLSYNRDPANWTSNLLVVIAIDIFIRMSNGTDLKTIQVAGVR